MMPSLPLPSMRSLFLFFSLFGLPKTYSQLPEVVIDDASLGSETYNWSSDSIYILDGLVYLEAGGLLEIEAGTVVKARQRPTSGDQTSALIISNGASIRALGRYLDPIVFTSEFDEPEVKGDLMSSDRGFWGGIIVMGDDEVITNDGDTVTMQHPALTEAERAQFGKLNGFESQIILNFVSVRHAGAAGMAGISLAGLNDEADLDFLEAFACAGDGIEFLGGIPDSRHLTSSFNAGNAFTWNYGYQGRAQFWFAIQGEDAGLAAIDGRGQASSPVIYNASLIGSGKESGLNAPAAVQFSEGSGGTLGMSVIAEFPNHGIWVEDLSGDEDSYARLRDSTLSLVSNIWGDFGAGEGWEDGVVRTSADITMSAELLALMETMNFARSNIYFQISRLPDDRLLPDGFLDEPYDFFSDDTLIYPDDIFYKDLLGFFCYGRGAFLEQGAWWIRHWTALYDNSYLQHPCIGSFKEDMAFAGIDQDTIELYCDQLDSLPATFDYICWNYVCNLPHQTLGVAMRMRRKKPKAGLEDNLPYCYVEELEFQGLETTFVDNPYVTPFLVTDSFTVTVTALVRDTTPPTFELKPCDDCGALPFLVTAADCDTAWIAGEAHDTLHEGNLTTVEHSWLATDRCGNESILLLPESLGAEATSWYQDKDGDGYGTSTTVIEWWQQLPGFTDKPGDCDDLDARKHPGNQEISTNALDDDCDGVGDIDLCATADLLPVLNACDTITYGLESASFDASITSFLCFIYTEAFDVDGWLKLVVPPSGNVMIEVKPFDENGSLFSNFEASLYSGSCNNLTSIECNPMLEPEGNQIILANNLVPGDTIWLRVGTRPWSRPNFTVCAHNPSAETTDVRETSQSIVSLQGFPNPVELEHSIDLFLQRTEKLDIYVEDLYGRTTSVIESGKIYTPGRHFIKFDTLDIVPGLYRVIVSTGSEVTGYAIVKLE